jgi:CheY-like chemotaxis protein
VKRSTLRGLRVFVAEDEFTVLLLVEDMLADLGCRLAGSASRVPEAMQAISRESIDVAVLDVNLAGEKVFPVAEKLDQRQVPLVFSTGYGVSGLEPRWRERPVLQKPYGLDDLARALLLAVNGSAE